MNSMSRVMLLVMWWVAGVAQAGDFETQTNREAGVTVKVTPVNLTAQTKSWDFEISLNTHTVALDQDMTQVVVLQVAGESLRPQTWQGDPPGGHHRKGVLRFAVPATKADMIELRINGIGKVDRQFRWAWPK